MIEAIALCLASVHDGDTVRSCSGEKIRISNIDAPEMPDSPKCADRRRTGWCDYALARKSRDTLERFLKTGPIAIHRYGQDRYNRTLATLSVNGKDAGDYLIGLGFARPWLKWPPPRS